MIAAVAALMVSINFMWSLMIIHDCYDRRDHWWSFMITGITSKLFSDRNDNMETKFHFASDRQQSQWLPIITMITIAGIESEYVCNRERSSMIAKS